MKKRATSKVSNNERIAVLETEMSGLYDQVHALNGKVDELLTIMNKGKGAFAASMILATSIGALLMAGITWVLSKF